LVVRRRVDLPTPTLHMLMVPITVTLTLWTQLDDTTLTDVTDPDGGSTDPALRPEGLRQRGEPTAGNASGPK
jgi:hypothetical protein